METPKPQLIAKRMLALEVFICVTAAVVLAALIAFASLVPIADWQKAILIAIGVVQFLVAAFCAVRIEQIVGFYQCAKCGYYYIPTYGSVLWGLHFGRTRYLKCPKCGQRSWQKKKLVKTDSSNGK